MTVILAEIYHNTQTHFVNCYTQIQNLNEFWMCAIVQLCRIFCMLQYSSEGAISGHTIIQGRSCFTK